MQNATVVEMITPSSASVYLTKNTRNRAIKKFHVAKLAKDMKNGDWSLNGQTIVFDGNGQLIDGQHRLAACVLSGVPFMSYVIHGVHDARAFTTTDVGRVRGASDMATYMGGMTATVAKDCVAAARIISSYDNTANKSEFLGFSPGGVYSNEELASYTLSLCPLLSDCNEMLGSKFYGMVDKSMILACAYIFSRLSHRDSSEFFAMLHAGVFSSKKHPVKVLRDTLLMRDRSARKSKRDTNGELMAIIFKAWAAFRKGNEIGLLRWSREGVNREIFPALV